MKNGTFGEKRWKNGRKNGRKTALFFTKIQSPVSGVEKWGEIEVSGHGGGVSSLLDGTPPQVEVGRRPLGRGGGLFFGGGASRRGGLL